MIAPREEGLFVEQAEVEELAQLANKTDAPRMALRIKSGQQKT